MFSRIRNFFTGNFEPAGKFRRPRVWSNDELRKIGHLFDGSVINVSGKVDSDKCGGVYRSYFPKAKEYFVSNYNSDKSAKPPEKWDFNINLDENIDPQFVGRFDVVFNHTTLEHIFDMHTAFKNLCAMSKDVVIIVLPFLQQMHWGASYKDYWRFTPYALKEMFEREGMTLLYMSGNNRRHESVYIFAVASKKPDLWKGKMPKEDPAVWGELGNRVI